MRKLSLAIAAALTLSFAAFAAPAPAKAGLFVNAPGVGVWVGGRRHHHRWYGNRGYYGHHGRHHGWHHRHHHRHWR